MVTSFFAWARRPANALRLAFGLTLVAILWLAPIYLENQWAAAQVSVAPWYVALVRKPVFAGIMMFTYAPAYYPSLYGLWALAAASWVNLFVARRQRAPHATHAAPVPAE